MYYKWMHEYRFSYYSSIIGSYGKITYGDKIICRFDHDVTTLFAMLSIKVNLISVPRRTHNNNNQMKNIILSITFCYAGLLYGQQKYYPIQAVPFTQVK